MKEVELLPHNEEAYEKLEKCLEENQMAAINHATGTGKSFIVLKYLSKNSNKRILYLAPTYPIIDQFLEDHTKELGIDIKEFNKIDSCIYSNLLDKDMEELARDYDIIILDEYHRCGAPKWGAKVNELLEIIKNKYPNTKVIGTTATEIRFLDNEKNMNNILFDGVCASTLTLADAILKGILPVPIYINAVYELYEVLDKIETKVKKKCFYSVIAKKYLDQIATLRNQLDIAMTQIDVINKYIGDNGKYLVFSSTIEQIEKDKKIINKIFKNNVSKNFIVHSGIKREKNKITIDEFKSCNRGNNFLYSVNILNEGLHVKGVDAIFMLRKTTSPTIYFQQLGRLLAYSKRNKLVFVFDLADNVKNHPYIYMLYQQLYKRAKELIELEPNNKEIYQNVLDRFKVINVTSNLYEQVDNLLAQTKTIKLKEERLNVAVLILEGKISSTVAERAQAQIDIFKFKNSIDLELFRRIKKIDIKKPKIFDLTIDEYELYLNDSNFKNKFNSENKDENLTVADNQLIFSNRFETILKKIDLELKSYKDIDDYVKKIYLDLLKFIKENNHSPRYSKLSDNILNYETELYFKKIIFYDNLNNKGYMDELISLEKELIKAPILSQFLEFVSNHNGELPSFKVDDEKEVLLAHKFKEIESLLSFEEINLINGLKEKKFFRVRQIVKTYIDFIKKYKRYPLKDSNNNYERELFYSYIRCEELFTKEEKEKIKSTFFSINKKQLLKNSYLEMIKNRK